jgi:hypothetical protein
MLPPWNCWDFYFQHATSLARFGIIATARTCAASSLPQSQTRPMHPVLKWALFPIRRATPQVRTNAFFLSSISPIQLSRLRPRYTAVSRYLKARVMSTCSMLWRFACTRHIPQAEAQHITSDPARKSDESGPSRPGRVVQVPECSIRHAMPTSASSPLGPPSVSARILAHRKLASACSS